MKRLVIERSYHLCLFALENINSGSEIVYSYGEKDLPWHKNEQARKLAERKQSILPNNKEQRKRRKCNNLQEKLPEIISEKNLDDNWKSNATLENVDFEVNHIVSDIVHIECNPDHASIIISVSMYLQFNNKILYITYVKYKSVVLIGE